MKYCSKFPCPNLATIGAYCSQHAPAKAPKETNPFYVSVAWRRFRDYYIGKHPLCEQCLIEGRETPASMVDHIIELKSGGELTSEDNAMSMCWKCHGRKTADEALKRNKINSLYDNHQLPTRDNRAGSQTRSY